MRTACPGRSKGPDCSSARWPLRRSSTVGPPAAVFAVGAIVYVVAASLVVSLPPTAHPDTVEADTSSDPSAGEPVAAERLNILDGIRVLREMPTSGSWSRSWPFVARSSGRWTSCSSSSPSRSTGRGASGAGILTGALGVGTMLGGAAAFSLVGRRRLAPALAFAVCLCGIALVATAVLGTGTTAPFLIVFAGAGVGGGRCGRSDDPPADDAGCGPRSRPRQSRRVLPVRHVTRVAPGPRPRGDGRDRRGPGTHGRVVADRGRRGLARPARGSIDGPASRSASSR